MAKQESFDVEVAGASVSASIRQPPSRQPGENAAVLICTDRLRDAEAAIDLGEEIAGALTAAGIAAVTYTPRDIADVTAFEALVDEASAVFRGMLLRSDVDHDRLGVLGHGLGAAVASCLAARTDAIARVCLLAPAALEDLTRRARRKSEPAEGNGQDAAPDESDDRHRAWLTRLADSAGDVDPAADAASRERPTLILHGAADRVVASSSGAAYAQRIRAAGHQAGFLLVARGDHEFTDAGVRAACLDRISGFFAAMAAITTSSAGA